MNTCNNYYIKNYSFRETRHLYIWPCYYYGYYIGAMHSFRDNDVMHLRVMPFPDPALLFVANMYILLKHGTHSNTR